MSKYIHDCGRLKDRTVPCSVLEMNARVTVIGVGRGALSLFHVSGDQGGADHRNISETLIRIKSSWR
jgi:hypothetical protein